MLLLLLMQYEYLWADGVKYKKPVRLSAPEYIDKLFDWVEAQVCAGGFSDWQSVPTCSLQGCPLQHVSSLVAAAALIAIGGKGGGVKVAAAGMSVRAGQHLGALNDENMHTLSPCNFALCNNQQR